MNLWLFTIKSVCVQALGVEILLFWEGCFCMGNAEFNGRKLSLAIVRIRTPNVWCNFTESSTSRKWLAALLGLDWSHRRGNAKKLCIHSEKRREQEMSIDIKNTGRRLSRVLAETHSYSTSNIASKTFKTINVRESGFRTLKDKSKE